MTIGPYLRHALWDKEDYLSCDPQTFTGIDQATHDRLLNFGSAQGVEFDGSKAKYKGLEFTWDYDAATETLIITCTKRPFVVGCGTVQEHISKLIQNGKGDSL